MPKLLKAALLLGISLQVLPASDIPWARLGLIWSSGAADLVTTHYAIGDGSRNIEANPILATSSGQLSARRYVALVAPLDVFLSYVTIKHPSSKAIRVATYISASVKFGVAVQNVSRSH